MTHRFPSDTVIDIPQEFTDPFRYSPHPLVRNAADALMNTLSSWAEMQEGSPEKEAERHLAEGKMLGILVIQDKEGKIGYLCGFSGSIGGRSMVKGFVPPVFDLLDPEGGFKKGEVELNLLNKRISMAESSDELASLRSSLSEAEQFKDNAISIMKARMALSKAERDNIRSATEDKERLEILIKESQHQKAELRRLKTECEERIASIKHKISLATEEIDSLRKERARKSDELQKWIFDRFIVSNILGEEASIREIFAAKGLVPPGGTGECAAPKLLNHAFRQGLTPLAMGEFWYGKASETAVRVHGHFYPSCTSKCGPLLAFMLKGLCLQNKYGNGYSAPIIIHEDNSVIVVEKPSGMPSVPGLDGKLSLQEMLGKDIQSVHRLDMDTSGVMVYARNPHSATNLQRQFEEHKVRKTYKARLSCKDSGRFSPIPHHTESKGAISLPLSPDYDERPRQKADMAQGQPALTEYEIINADEDGTIDILFHPITGRTHQLRVHSAHSLGLGRPIAGDMLYGGNTAERLHLHALSITFTHPESGQEMTFCSEVLGY